MLSGLIFHGKKIPYKGLLIKGCVRLASLGRPQSDPVRTALTGLTRVSPKCPACGVGHFGVTCGACRHRERASVIVRLALVRASPIEHRGVKLK